MLNAVKSVLADVSSVSPSSVKRESELVNQSDSQSVSQSVSASISQSVNQPVIQSLSQSVRQSVSQLAGVRQSVSQSVISVCQSVSQSVNQLVSQPSVSQSVGYLISQLTSCAPEIVKRLVQDIDSCTINFLCSCHATVSFSYSMKPSADITRSERLINS